ncbi:hypothetical protein GMRT_11658 [Giardia muris]|uniref:Signal recognition particle receptor subunit beta n=1 Tax=Giardia muris TaxID=5742 RepID=A0A4Z1T1H5_GIAMU|nr:hypothetical protein GMRT_11658 [Giardia muris]|eukprot:TNJ29548.1 hypothetical protein GMRT_11658 [Giardia muris]
MINIEAIVVITLFTAFVLWGLMKTRRIGEGRPPTLLLLRGSPHAGKTQVFYSLTSQAPAATVRTVEGSVYTGALGTIPGLTFKVYDMPSDIRARPSLPDKYGGVLVVFLQRGTDCSSLVDAYLSEMKNRKLSLFLIIPIDITVKELKASLYKELTAQTGTTITDEKTQATLSITDTTDFDPIRIKDLILTHILTKLT